MKNVDIKSIPRSRKEPNETGSDSFIVSAAHNLLTPEPQETPNGKERISVCLQDAAAAAAVSRFIVLAGKMQRCQSLKGFLPPQTSSVTQMFSRLF